MSIWLWFWVLSTVVLLAILGGLGMLVAQGRIGQAREERPTHSALQLLEERYLRREITTAEYQRRRAELP
jgi:uncharacterized membrane protein